MSADQIKSTFKEAHANQLQKVANAQFVHMEAAANLAAERVLLRELEKNFRVDMASATSDNQLQLPLGDAKKK